MVTPENAAGLTRSDCELLNTAARQLVELTKMDPIAAELLAVNLWKDAGKTSSTLPHS